MNTHCNGVLNHLSLPTANPAATAAFFEKFFGCEVVAAGGSYLLRRDGFDLVLDRVDEAPAWPANFHFGFEMGTLEEVRRLYREFLDGGVQMETEVFNNSRGSRFFCRTPEGVLIEVNTREDKANGWQNIFQPKS